MKLFAWRGRVPMDAGQSAPHGLLAGCHVLLVDDDDECRLMLRTALSLEGAHVSEADGAKRALEIAAAARCDVVVTDITMGRSRRDGLWLLDRFRASEALRQIPVIALTGCRELQPALTACGFDRVLIKPVDVLDVPSTIMSLRSGARSLHLAA